MGDSGRAAATRGPWWPWPVVGAAVLAAPLLREVGWLPAPFAAVALVWTACGIALARGARRTAAGLLLAHASAVAFALGAFEAWLWSSGDAAEEDRATIEYSVDYYRADPVLGYAAYEGIRAQVEKRYDGELVYAATYTIGPSGLRVTPEATDAAYSVLFFGGSVTFGEGVDDEQSMPYRVAERLGDRVQVYNFGFHGYGPHQMLAALERGKVASIVREPAAAAIYQTNPAHVARAAGRTSWDTRGPWYRLDADGVATHAGRFDDRFSARFAVFFERSLAYRQLLGRERPIRDADIELHAAIVDRARREIERSYPACAFSVLLWGQDGDPVYESMREALRRRKLPVHLVRDVLPGYLEDPTRYEIGAHDAHPSALAHARIAEYVATRMVPAARGPERAGAR